MNLVQIFKSISSKEWWLVGFLGFILIIITSLPVLYGVLVTPENQVFTAMHFVSADDWFVYYSFINQGSEGNFLFNDLFSPVEHLEVLRPFWLGVGVIAGVLNLSAPAAFHLVRILLIPVFLFIAYLFLAYIFKDQAKRKFSLIFLSFSSGLGIFFIGRLVLFPLNYAKGGFQWPMDLWVPEINTFLTLFTSPHFIGATILILLIFLLTALFTENGKYSYAIWSGLAGLVLFSFHPFQVLKVFAIIAIFFLVLMIRHKKIIWSLVNYFLVFLMVSLPSIIYYSWLLKFDWLTYQRALQNINPTTSVNLTMFAFGGLFAFGMMGIFYLAENKKLDKNKYLFITIWLIVQLLLFYAPVNYQRRLSLGVHFPLVILSTLSMFYLYGLHKKFIQDKAAIFIVLSGIIFLPSTLFAVSADVMVFSLQRELSYISQDEHRAYLWLRQNIEPTSVTFSAVKTGNVLPAYALRPSYVGHAVETPFFREKKLEPAWFYGKNRPLETEKSFLQDRGISYVFYGKREQELGNYDPAIKPYLVNVYSSDEVKIYERVD